MLDVAVNQVKPNRALRDLPKPEPSAGLAAYDGEREACLALDPRKKANFERYMASRRRSAEVDYLPIKLDIENVSRCNFRCRMCVVSDWPKRQRAADMTVEDFKELIESQYGLVEIKLQGIGEPLMQGPDFFEMIRYARARRIWVRTTTNASLLHLKDNYKKLVDCDPNEIQISVDGATKEVFERIRRGSVFSRVMDNCKVINAYAQSQGKRITKMWTVAQRDNWHQLRDLVDLASELGFQDQAFAFTLTNWGTDEWRDRNDEITVEEELDVELAEELLERGRERGVKVSFWNSTTKYKTNSLENLCPWPFERAVVTSDMRTVPCCTIGDPDAYEIGRGSGKDLATLWNNEEYAEFRRAHLRGEIPEVCQICYDLDDEDAAKQAAE